MLGKGSIPTHVPAGSRVNPWVLSCEILKCWDKGTLSPILCTNRAQPSKLHTWNWVCENITQTCVRKTKRRLSSPIWIASISNKFSIGELLDLPFGGICCLGESVGKFGGNLSAGVSVRAFQHSHCRFTRRPIRVECIVTFVQRADLLYSPRILLLNIQSYISAHNPFYRMFYGHAVSYIGRLYWGKIMDFVTKRPNILSFFLASIAAGLVCVPP